MHRFLRKKKLLNVEIIDSETEFSLQLVSIVVVVAVVVVVFNH
jgi:hypothetical protein